MSSNDEKSSQNGHHLKDEKNASSTDLESPSPLPELTGNTQLARNLDVSLALPGMTGVHGEDEVDPEEARRVKRKLDWRLLPLLFAIYTLQFLDKNAMAASSILGFLSDNHLTQAQYNNLGTFFYLGYLVSQLPHALAFQKLPVAKYLAVMMFIWALLVGMHAVGHDYHGLVAIRFLLGWAEGCITPGLMLISSMFYTRREMGERVGYTFQCNGFATIISGFIAYGVYHAPANTPAHPQKVAQWQWFMIIVSILTLIVSVLFFLFFPDSPTNARFLTEHERVIAVKRIRSNQTGIETKVWKKSQFIEAIMDPKAWMFMLFAILADFVGGMGIQYSIIIKDFGFTVGQTTLLNIPSGAGQIIGVTCSLLVFHRYSNARGWISSITYLPSIIGASLLIGLGSGKVGLLISFYMLLLGNSPAVVLSLSWITATTSGHTKKLTLNCMWLLGYSVGQMVSTQWWKAKYQPRNRVPWTIILTSYCCQAILVLIIRQYFDYQNKKRDRAAAAATTEEEKEKFSEYGWIDVPGKDGEPAKRIQIEKRFLDMTDHENLSFRYCL